MTIALADGGTVTVSPPETPTFSVSPPPQFSVSVVSPSGAAGEPGTGGGDGGAALLAHITAAQPHPAYDVEMPSLTLLFENGLV